MISLFFVQAEDGIRDGHVTGVQTCALPISAVREGPSAQPIQIWQMLLRVNVATRSTWRSPSRATRSLPSTPVMRARAVRRPPQRDRLRFAGRAIPHHVPVRDLRPGLADEQITPPES